MKLTKAKSLLWSANKALPSWPIHIFRHTHCNFYFSPTRDFLNSVHHLTASVETALLCHQEQNYKMKIFLFHDPSSTGQVSAEVIRHIRCSRFQFQTRTNFSFSFIWRFLFEKIVWLFLLLRAAKWIDGILFFLSWMFLPQRLSQKWFDSTFKILCMFVYITLFSFNICGCKCTFVWWSYSWLHPVPHTHWLLTLRSRCPLIWPWSNGWNTADSV